MFCKRHGIRNLSLQGEQLSADNESSDAFVSSFAEEEQQLSLHQIFNCDETGLLLPDKTLASSFEKSADGKKKSKDRVTINANATGSMKLPLQLIGKAKGLSYFRGLRMDLLPVGSRMHGWATEIHGCPRRFSMHGSMTLLSLQCVESSLHLAYHRKLFWYWITALHTQ